MTPGLKTRGSTNGLAQGTRGSRYLVATGPLRALFVLLGVFASACSGPAPGPEAPPAAPPDVVLITVDTLRADRVGGALTPSINALGARGARFLAARTTAPLTLPAHVSLMTGAIPPVTGVRLNGAHRFDDARPTLATLLKGAGRETAAFIGAFVLDRQFGLATGFDTYDDQIARAPGAPLKLEAERPASAVADRAIAWVRARQRAGASAGGRTSCGRTSTIRTRRTRRLRTPSRAPAVMRTMGKSPTRTRRSAGCFAPSRKRAPAGPRSS